MINDDGFTVESARASAVASMFQCTEGSNLRTLHVFCCWLSL